MTAADVIYAEDTALNTLASKARSQYSLESRYPLYFVEIQKVYQAL